MNLATLAYLAGIIDGEGHIGCYYEHGGYRERVVVHMKRKLVPEYLHKVFPNVSFLFKKTNGGWVWVANAGLTRSLLKEIRPFMVEKQDQVDLILKMEKLKQETKIGKKDLPDLAEAKKKVYLDLKKLHHQW